MNLIRLISQLLTGLYFISLGGLALYGLHRIWFLFHWYREQCRSVVHPSSPPLLKKDLKVTVQLPVYNERFVAARLLDAAATLDWPPEMLEIQVLDDSTDDTRAIIDERVAYWAQNGTTINILRRKCRDGFKAGALAKGIRRACGDFIAIFDADFLPPPDFLLRTLPYFSDPRVGMVQARWDFINAGQSWVTRIQALLLGPHFGIEHLVRSKRGLFFNFNGTAGVWRRSAIESSGGWQSRTVTEDLDLSYRAQLAGWRFVYLNDLLVPSELPVTLDGFRSQQQRWAKGSIQTARKILPTLVSRSLPVPQKIEAAFHLLANMGWLLGTVVTLTLYPVIFLRMGIGPYQLLRLDLPLLLGGGGAILLYFFLYAVSQNNRSLIYSVLLLPVLTIGLAPSLSLAVIEGLWREGGVFERTPKFGCKGKGRLPELAFLYHHRKMPYLVMNVCLFSYTILPLVFSFQRGTWVAIPFLLIFPAGLFLVIIKDMKEIRWNLKRSLKNA